MGDEKIVKGTFLLTAATMISRILGLIYMFPFLWLVGYDGLALYGYAYIPYAILLSVSTVGLPKAVSKYVAKYETLGDTQTGIQLLKSGLTVTFLTGLFSFGLLYWFADDLAVRILRSEEATGNRIEDVTFVIRIVGLALLIVPMMSLLRGFFQGKEAMAPTAVSQVVEQVVRIVFILVTAFIVMKLGSGNVTHAVGFAVLGAFIGAIGGLITLYIYWKKSELSLKTDPFDSLLGPKWRAMYKEIVLYAIPFIFAGLAIPLYQLVDTFTMVRALTSSVVGLEQESAEAIYAMVTQSVHKVILIPVSLATALGLTLVPAITKSYTAGAFHQLHHQLNQTFQLLFFLVLPAVVGLMVLARPVYGTLYLMNGVDQGAALLQLYAPAAILFSLFTVTGAILQGLNKQALLLYSMFLGLLIKSVSNYGFVQLWGGTGAIVATELGFFVSVAMNLWVMKREVNFSFSYIARRTLFITILVSAMAITVGIINKLLGFLIPAEAINQEIIRLLIGVIIGIIVYVGLSVRSHFAPQIIGERWLSRLPGYKRMKG